jgi:hypothetical protein
MQARLGPILCVAPANVAMDNFAERLNRMTAEATTRYNQRKRGGIRRKLVVRGFKSQLECDAFMAILEFPDTPDCWVPRVAGSLDSKWRLELSVTYWLLVVLRSPLVDQLTDVDSKALHSLRSSIDSREDLAPLRKLATREVTKECFLKLSPSNMGEKVKALMHAIVNAADFLCVASALCENDYKHWKDSFACGLVVDEAANINRADVICAWGNTLLPCILGGDPRQ